MTVYVSNIVIEQGYEFETTFQLQDTRTNTPLVLSGIGTTDGATAQIRKSYASSKAVSFGSSILDTDNGLITISLTAAQSSALKPGRYVYDVKLTNSTSGKEYKAVEGNALVRAGVTR